MNCGVDQNFLQVGKDAFVQQGLPPVKNCGRNDESSVEAQNLCFVIVCVPTLHRGYRREPQDTFGLHLD